MKKILLTLLLLTPFIFFVDEVNAATDYLFVSTTVPTSDSTTQTVGSQNPGIAYTNSQWVTLAFGYYNINGTFKPGEKWRIVANYCVKNNQFGVMQHEGTFGSNLVKNSFSYGNECVYTSSDGNVEVGINLYFTVDFTIDGSDYTQGFIRFAFTRGYTDKTFFAFKDYTIYPSSEITDNDNTQNIIDNQNQNQQQTNEKLDNIDGTLNNDNIDSSGASGFFGDYKDNDYGLSSVITAPLEFIRNLNSNICTDLSVPLPYVNKNLTLPCMNNVYNKHFGSVFTLYQTITTGFIAYWVCVRIFALVKGFKDPEDDKIEVMDL